MVTLEDMNTFVKHLESRMPGHSFQFTATVVDSPNLPGRALVLSYSIHLAPPTEGQKGGLYVTLPLDDMRLHSAAEVVKYLNSRFLDGLQDLQNLTDKAFKTLESQ